MCCASRGSHHCRLSRSSRERSKNCHILICVVTPHACSLDSQNVLEDCPQPQGKRFVHGGTSCTTTSSSSSEESDNVDNREFGCSRSIGVVFLAFWRRLVIRLDATLHITTSPSSSSSSSSETSDIVKICGFPLLEVNRCGLGPLSRGIDVYAGVAFCATGDVFH